MRRPRTLAAAALVLIAAVFVPSAAAVDPFPTNGVTTLTGDHFMIHYSRVDDSTDCPTVSITQETAGNVLGWAERAYSYYSSWGYAAPVLDNFCQICGKGLDQLVLLGADRRNRVPQVLQQLARELGKIVHDVIESSRVNVVSLHYG